MIKSSHGRHLKSPERLMILKIIWLQNAVIKTVLSKETFEFLGIVQDFVILVRRLLNFLTNDLIITGFVRVAQNPL